MNFNWEEFKKSKFVVHCKTREESDDFIKQCKINNVRGIVDTNTWNIHKSMTCYRCNQLRIEYEMVYANYCYYEENYYKIIEWSDYMEQENKEEKTYMEKVAEMFNMPIDKEFIIDGIYGVFKFSKTTLLCKYMRDWISCPEVLTRLLSGEYGIITSGSIEKNYRN